MESHSQTNPFPIRLVRRADQARAKSKALRVSNSSHSGIDAEIARRARLDYDETNQLSFGEADSDEESDSDDGEDNESEKED